MNEAVDLAKKHGGKKAGALVNGVARSFLREKKEVPLPPADDAVRHLSVAWSHPEWLVKRWLDYFGPEETEPLLKANNEEAPLVLRVNRLRGDRESLIQMLSDKGLAARPSHWSPQGIILEGAGRVEELPGFKEGLFQVQGEASQMMAFLLDPKPGERILDACAAPGGKTTHLAELIEDRGEIIATDISARGLEKLRENVQRLALVSVRAFLADVTKELRGTLALPYDRILVDAPCTGLGTLRSHPEAKWQKTERDIDRLKKLQQRILDRASRYLKAGGVLVYATCTLTREENEEVVEDFLARHGDFALGDARACLPGAQELVSGKYLLALPHRHNTDGFFAARMERVRECAK